MDLINKSVQWLITCSNEIGINVIAGLTASIIVLFSQTLVKTAALIIASLFSIKFQLSKIWQIRRPQRIYVVSGSIGVDVPTEIKTAILAGPDADAASSVIATLGLLYPQAEIQHVYSSSFPREEYKENLVIIGGPVNNQCAASFLDYVKDRAHYTKDFEFVTNNSRYSTQYDKNQHSILDYGVIIRITNPFNNARDVIIISGCDTHGVLAAATLISSKNETKVARRKLRSFLGLKSYFYQQDYVAVIECAVLGNTIGHIKTKEVLHINKNEK
jgi:hypothetical protein